MENIILTGREKRELLHIAREAIKSYLRDKRTPDIKTGPGNLAGKNGVFVTLKENNDLRGCIGSVSPDTPLYLTVAEMAVEAAVNDPRFSPVRGSELDKIEIEISVLSSFEDVEDIEEIEIGKHGLLIRKGFNAGLLLPQVPVEFNWDRKTFLEQLCLKAGLSGEAYKTKGEPGMIRKFTAVVFSESSLE